MVKSSYDFEELLADLAQLRGELERVRQERDSAVARLETAEGALTKGDTEQSAAYRQMAEIERVLAFDDAARGIEHDLYNALTPVEGYTELLLAMPERLADRVQATAYLSAILAAARDAKQVIERLREFYYSKASAEADHPVSASDVLARALEQQGVDEPEEPGARHEPDFMPDATATESLSPREWDVLHLLAEGKRNREIAETLVVSENTVKTHIRAILAKLSLKNRTQAAAYALLDSRAY